MRMQTIQETEKKQQFGNKQTSKNSFENRWHLQAINTGFSDGWKSCKYNLYPAFLTPQKFRPLDSQSLLATRSSSHI